MRSPTWTLLALLGAAALLDAAPFPQDAAPAPSETRAGLEDWRARLTDEDLGHREHAFERLIQAVRQNPSLGGVLHEWAADPAHPELAWTARLALRELGRTPASLFQDLFQAPTFSSATWPWPDLPGGLAVLRVETEAKGKRETKTYAGESLGAILEANPELAQRLSTGRSALQRFAPQSGWPAAPDLAPETPAAPLRTDVLGVIVREPTPAERGRAGLKQGGLAVEQVPEGTIAEVLGLRPGVILVEINGSAIDDKEAISAALAARAPDGELRVTLFDAFGRRQTRTWRPAPAGQAQSASGF